MASDHSLEDVIYFYSSSPFVDTDLLCQVGGYDAVFDEQG